MKKMAALFLALLLLTQAFSALALVKSMDIPIDQQGMDENALQYIDSAATLNGKLYLFSNGGVFAWDGESGEMTELTIAQVPIIQDEKLAHEEEPAVQEEEPAAQSEEPHTEEVALRYFGPLTLIADGETLYSLDINAGTLTELVITDTEITFGETVSFSNEGLLVPQEDYSYAVQIYASVLRSNKLYLLTSSEDQSNYYARVLHEIDLQTGKSETLLEGTNLSAMTAYKDGNLLIKVFDRDKYYMNDQSEADLPALTVFDTKQKKLAQTISTLKNINASGFAYDEKTDILYMVMDGQLFRQTAAGAPEVINYIMNEAYNDSPKTMLIGSAQYVLIDYANVFIRSTDPADRPSEVLRVTGADFTYTGKAGYEAFVKEHPEIVVTSLSDAYFSTAEALYQDFLTSTAGDIYSVFDAGVLQALIKKGYCMDLSGSDKLTEAVRKMYPHMTQDLFKDGKLYAVPLTMSVNSTMGYSPSLFERIGIAKDDVPRTLSAFMDFMVDWVDIYADENPDLDLIRYESQPMRNLLLNTILSQQLAYCQKMDISVTFDTPQMHAVLSKLDEVMPIISELDPEERSSGYVSYEDEIIGLLDPYYFLFGSYRSENDDYEPLLLGLADDVPMMHMGYMNMLMVNPNTKNPEMAIAFLESLVTNMEDESAVMLYPDRNEPKENPSYSQDMKRIDEEIKLLNDRIEKETDELIIEQLQKNLQEYLDSNKSWFEYLEKNRYAISPEAIAFYRSIAINVFPTGGGYAIFGQTDSLRNLFTRLFDGQIPSEQFIKETEKILKMIRLENQ